MFPNRRPRAMLYSSENLRMYKPGFVLVLFLGLAQYAQAALPSTEVRLERIHRSAVWNTSGVSELVFSFRRTSPTRNWAALGDAGWTS